MAEAAKQKRVKAKRLFTRKCNTFDLAVDTEVALDVVETRFDALKCVWESAQYAHEEYVEALMTEAGENPINEAEVDEWLLGIEERYNMAEIRRFKYRDDQTEKENARLQEVSDKLKLEAETVAKTEIFQNIEIARRARYLHETSFKNQADHLTSILVNKISDEHPVELAVNAHAKLIPIIAKAEKAHGELLALLNNDEVDREMTWLNDIQKIYNKIEDKFVIYTKSEIKLECKSSPAKIKLEPLKLPSFDGHARSYLRFKSDFTKFVLPEIQNNSKAAYVLKSCLSDTPKRLVQNIEDDVQKIWDRLDERFGRPGKIADLIMHDIKEHRFLKEGDDPGLLDFIEMIETSHSDLVRVGMECEISNSATVSLIEEKLPRSMMREWAKEINKTGTSVNERNKLPSLIAFLNEQRKIIEYENDNLRSKYAVFSKPKCWFDKMSDHTILKCKAFLELSPEKRADAAKSAGACWSCLNMGHIISDCKNKRMCGENECRGFHHPLIHVHNFKGHAFKTVSHNPCILQIMSVKSPCSRILTNVLWDGGSTISLITHRKAKEMNLKGTRVNLNICKLGEKEEKISTMQYIVPLIDKNGLIIQFTVFGFENISTVITPINLDVARLFGIDKSSIQRGIGEVDMLIGIDYANFHPQIVRNVDHLVLLSCRFGYCLGGKHPLINEGTSRTTPDVKVYHLKGTSIDDFIQNESLGIQVTPACGNCACGECAFGAKQYSIKDENELKLIEKGLTFEVDHWEASYPWKTDPKNLPNNKSMALACLKSTEKRLKKNPIVAKLYSEQIEEMIEEGIARKLSFGELQNYKGPVHYVAHHAVLKASSSTPCRIVFNSSARFCNAVLNDFWVKGPDLLNNLLGVLIRFRENYFAIVGDIRRMYHTIRISQIDQHVHRFLWRQLNESKKTDEFAITRVSFGDRPSGAIASLALRKTALMSKEKYPIASRCIIENSYVDDILDSFPDLETGKKKTRRLIAF